MLSPWEIVRAAEREQEGAELTSVSLFLDPEGDYVRAWTAGGLQCGYAAIIRDERDLEQKYLGPFDCAADAEDAIWQEVTHYVVGNTPAVYDDAVSGEDADLLAEILAGEISHRWPRMAVTIANTEAHCGSGEARMLDKVEAWIAGWLKFVAKMPQARFMRLEEDLED